MNAREIAKQLGVKLDLDDFYKRGGEEFAMHQLKRRVRYYCFAMQRRAVDHDDKVRVPKKLIEYFENLHQFEHWGTFGETWDVKEKSPNEIYFRDFSLLEEHEALMRRVVPDLPIDRVWRQNGPEGNV